MFDERRRSSSSGGRGNKGPGRGGLRGRKDASGKRQSRTPRTGGFSRRPLVPKIAEGTSIDYKNIALIQKFVTERGKIMSPRLTGLSAKRQRELATAVQRARFVGLLSSGSAKRK